MILYHASRESNLHKIGIDPDAPKTCCNFNDGFVYLADLDYLYQQYFSYCPKGIYYIFEVDVEDESLIFLPDVNHYKHFGCINKKFVKPYTVKVVK